MIRSFRHWFSQQLIHQKSYTLSDTEMGVQNNDSQMNDLALPSFKEVFANPKAPEDVHVAISKTQVFRADDSERDFTELKDMKMDSLEDMH